MKYSEPIACVGVVVLREDEVLIVKRKNPPNAGAWSIPGGRIEPGEDQEAAVHRELLEETQLKANILGEIIVIDAEFDNVPYRLHDYAAVWTSGEPIAGDDASDARFIPLTDVNRFIDWDKTREVINMAHQMVRDAKMG